MSVIFSSNLLYFFNINLPRQPHTIGGLMEDDSFINSITVEACITYLKQYDNGRCQKKIYVFFVKLSMREIWGILLENKIKGNK